MKSTEIHPKIQATGLSGAMSIVLVWAAGLAGLDMSPEVAAAFSVIMSAVAGYLMPNDPAPAGDEGHAAGGVLLTVVLFLAAVALCIWIVQAL